MTEDPREEASGVVEEYLAERLELADQPPGVREAVESRFGARIDEISARGKSQISHLEAKGPTRPQVYYAHEEVLEDELQEVAAGVRTALAMEGRMVDAVPFEQAAAFRLAPTAAWAIRSEASRVPRPPTRPDVLKWSLPPVPWLENSESSWPPEDANALEALHELPTAEPARCSEAPYQDWVQLGFVERQRTLPSKHPEQPYRNYSISVGLEVTNGEPPKPYQPFASSSPAIWTIPADELVPALSSAQAQANLAALPRYLACLLDFDSTPGVPHPNRGPGLHPFLLAPHIELVALLGLQPETPTSRLALLDGSGPALVCRQWSAFLIHDGNYEPLEPAVVGTDLLLRADLYETAKAAIGQDRIRLGFSLRVSS